MGVSIIRGAISSGKSRICLEQIEKLHREKADTKCIMIVPDHYSYETEKKFVERFGGTGFNNIEVLTLRRMAVNFLSTAQLNHLTASGKQMLIYRAVSASCAELEKNADMDMKLITAMRRRGFLDVAVSLISEMKRYLVTPELLRKSAAGISDNKTLENKLNALCLVYEKYLEYVEDSGCTDSDDDLYMLAEHIQRNNEFDEKTYVWVNRFDKFMPQQISVLEALLKKGVHMTFGICCPKTSDETERELYRQTKKTVDKVMELAAEYGFEGEYTAGEGLSHIVNRPDLYKLLKCWTEDFSYEEKTENIAFFQSRDTYSEIERIACEITDLVREDGFRFGEIALLCGDEEEYRHLTEAVFAEYEIPYFTDRKIILSDHPIAMQILSLFRIPEDDWSYDSVFRYLRAGFIYERIEKNGKQYYKSIDMDKVDVLENFVLRCGIRGAKKWLGDDIWTDKNDIVGAAFGDEEQSEANEMIEELRRSITAPLESFFEKVKGRKKAREFAEALFEYLEDINLYAGLKSDIARFNKKGMVNEAEQFTKIWNLILDVLDQMVTALNEMSMSISEFEKYIAAGLSKCEIRTIPSGIDQVYVGSVERSSHSNVRAMFVVGAKNGTFPENIKTEGFLSNRDRSILKDDFGVAIAPDTKKKMDEQYFKVYRALCAVSEKLYFSYSVQDEEGNRRNPSHMITEICRKFKNIRKSNNLLGDNLQELKNGKISENGSTDHIPIYISSPKATIHKMLINLSDRYKGRRNPLWKMVYDWYSEKEEWKKILHLADRADYYDRRGVVLDKDMADLLYAGKIIYSASRINTFARCPFEYFLKYGLSAKEREEWDITPANMGSYAHRVINDFCQRVEDGAETNGEKIVSWRSLTDEKREEILDEIINSNYENILSSNMRDKERTANIFMRMGKTVSEAARLVQKSLAAGNFAENGMEKEFEIPLTENVAIRGIIDRIDTCETKKNGTYMRIVDYKTGKTEFNIINIFNGCDMQMVIYALAAAKLMRQSGKDTEVTGIYYTAVKSEYKKLNASTTEENIRDVRYKEMILDGMTFAGEGEEETGSVLYNMDNDFFKNQSCAFAKVKMDKDGKITGVESMDEINGLMKYVEDTVIDMDGRARNGDIALNPYDSNGQGGVCEYCAYGSVCKFDEKKKEKRVPDGDKDGIWEIMKTKGAAMRGEKTNG